LRNPHVESGTLQEKYLQKTFKIKKANARALQNLQTRQNNELSAIISLEDAKPSF
jgi:hypothetical protein